ncbi:MAG: nuclease-related domain-containing protein [Cyanobacteria bacterium P01_C01_bin.69]
MLRSFPRKSKKRSPLKDKPLRNPGQSLDESISQVMDDEVLILVATASGCIGFTVDEWIQWYFKRPPNPLPTTVFCGLLFIYCFYRLLTTRQKLKTLKMARDGERAVGQYLDLLREDVYRVFHDVVGDNFNIDHVVVGRNGIFTVETKTYRKPLKGRANIHFDGETITVNGAKLDRNPVVQAQAQAGWLSTQIQESTGHTHKVQPVVVFPGWFVTSHLCSESRSDVWVINPKGISKFIENTPQRIAPEEVRLVSYHLSRYIRANNHSYL